MATQNSANQQYSNETDGFKLAGGSTKRELSLTGGDVAITGSGTDAQYSFPAATDTLVGRDSTDTITGDKTFTGDVDLTSANVSLPNLVDAGIGTADQAIVHVGTLDFAPKSVEFHLFWDAGINNLKPDTAFYSWGLSAQTPTGSKNLGVSIDKGDSFGETLTSYIYSLLSVGNANIRVEGYVSAWYPDGFDVSFDTYFSSDYKFFWIARG